MTQEMQTCQHDLSNVELLPAIPKTSTSRDGALNELAMRIASVELSTPVGDILETRMMLSFMSEQVKELKARMDAALTEWIAANGPIEWGTKRIILSKKKDTKCRDTKAALVALLEASGGDWAMFAQAIASNGIKYGAAREIMGEQVWQQHFEVIEKSEVKEVVEVDTKFLPKQRSK